MCRTTCDEAIDRDLAEAYAEAVIVGDGSGVPVGIETTTPNDRRNPAIFSVEIINALREILPRITSPGVVVHDPFAGEGNRLAALCDELGYTFSGTDIEAWPNADPRVKIGDSTDWATYPDRDFYIIVTSPTYNNGVNDHFDPKDDSRRLTYRSRLGRALKENNTGRYSGRGSKKGEAMYWLITEQCVVHWPARVIVNVKDSYRGPERYRLVDQWQALLEDYGYAVETVEVECPGWRVGTNSEKRVATEAILICRKEHKS